MTSTVTELCNIDRSNRRRVFQYWKPQFSSTNYEESNFSEVNHGFKLNLAVLIEIYRCSSAAAKYQFNHKYLRKFMRYMIWGAFIRTVQFI